MSKALPKPTSSTCSQSKLRFRKYYESAGGNWLSTRNFTRSEVLRGRSGRRHNQSRQGYLPAPRKDSQLGFLQRKLRLREAEAHRSHGYVGREYRDGLRTCLLPL